MYENNLNQLNTLELLQLHGCILDELKQRNIIRTYNNPVGDYAEWLVAQKLDLELANCSKTGYDGISKNNIKYQIKARRNHTSNESRQLNVIRKFNENSFDFLIAVLFNKDFTIKEAYKLAHDTIPKYAKYSNHQNGYLPILPRNIASDPDVEDISNMLNFDN